jgi:hypothetical protein
MGPKLRYPTVLCFDCLVLSRGGYSTYFTKSKSVHTLKGLALPQAWNAGDVSPPGRSRRSDTLAAAPVLFARVLLSQKSKARRITSPSFVWMQAEEERRHAAEWEADRVRGLERAKEESRARKDRDAAMKADLDAMASVRSKMRSEFKTYEATAEQEALARWNAERAAAEERERSKREAERLVCVSVCMCVLLCWSILHAYTIWWCMCMHCKAWRESLRRYRPGGLTSSAFCVCGSASSFNACYYCNTRISRVFWARYEQQPHYARCRIVSLMPVRVML